MFSILGIYLSFFERSYIQMSCTFLGPNSPKEIHAAGRAAKYCPLVCFGSLPERTPANTYKLHIYINVYARCHFSKFCTYAHGIRKIIMIACNNSMICFFLMKYIPRHREIGAAARTVGKLQGRLVQKRVLGAAA